MHTPDTVVEDYLPQPQPQPRSAQPSVQLDAQPSQKVSGKFIRCISIMRRSDNVVEDYSPQSQSRPAWPAQPAVQLSPQPAVQINSPRGFDSTEARASGESLHSINGQF